jgi:hypothetical protein
MELVEELARVVRQEMDGRYRPDCCIAATRILLSVADYFRLTALPLCVQATVFNPVMSQRLEHEAMPSQEEAERSWFPAGCHSVGLGVPGDSEPGRWQGHLVAVVERHLLDITLDQASRPQHGIVLPAVCVCPLDLDFLMRRAMLQGRCNGCLVRYLALPTGAGDFQRAPDWRSKRHHATIAAQHQLPEAPAEVFLILSPEASMSPFIVSEDCMTRCVLALGPRPWPRRRRATPS